MKTVLRTALRASLLLAAVAFVQTMDAQTRIKPRMIITTDGEVDDRSSMIRALMYSSDYDIVGIVEVNSRFQKSGHSGETWLEDIINRYEAVRPNLIIHHPGYPTAAYLRSVTRVGNENSADLFVAPPNMATKDTAGERLIIERLLDNDPRPVHVPSWGGVNTTASALWRLKSSGQYTAAQYNYAVSRIRIYSISLARYPEPDTYQDGGGAWIEQNIPGALINDALRWEFVWDYKSTVAEGTVSPPDVAAYMTSSWLNSNVKSGHGVLGAYSPQTYVSEGDTPSFLHLINNGLEAQEDYTLGGWGGRSAFTNRLPARELTDRNLRDDGDANKMFWRWVIAAQNDFAARMDWCVKNTFAGANHAPVARVNGALARTVQPGQVVTLDATGTSDPDGNTLTYRWWQYADADSASAVPAINNSTSATSGTFVVPNEAGKQLHVILEVTDNGTPRLVGYRRIIFTIGNQPPPPPPPPPGSIQGENAVISGGILVESNQVGFNGTGFLNFPPAGGSAQFNGINGGPRGGSASLTIRFANGASSGARTGLLVVNGLSRAITFASTGEWTTWATMNVSINLNSGTANTIRLESNGQDLGNIDQITVTLSDVPPPPPPPPPGTIADGTYRVINQNSLKALDALGGRTADGTAIIQYTYSGGNNQRWMIQDRGNNQFSIIGVSSGKALNVIDAGTGNGTKLELRTYTGANNQKWTFTTVGSNYRVTPMHATGSALEIEGASTANGGLAQIWAYTSGNHQLWSFTAP